MKTNDLDGDAFFTTDGTDVWELIYYFLQPTCRLKNLQTGREEFFGMGGLTAENFHKIEMPKGVTKK